MNRRKFGLPSSRAPCLPSWSHSCGNVLDPFASQESWTTTGYGNMSQTYLGGNRLSYDIYVYKSLKVIDGKELIYSNLPILKKVLRSTVYMCFRFQNKQN